MTRPIRAILWLLGLAVLAVGIALAGKYSDGYLVIIAAGHRVELSLNLAALLLGLAFVSFYILIRVIAVAIQAPQRLRAWKAENARTAARADLLDALRGLFSGRFDHSERAAKRAMEHEDTRDMGATVAAWAAFEGGHAAEAVPYLKTVQAAEASNMRDASLAYVLLADGKTRDALPLLQQLHDRDPKNPGVLKMKLEAELAEKAWEEVLRTLPQVVKTGLMPEAAAAQIRLNAELNLIKKKSGNRDGLLYVWSELPSSSRFDPAVANAVARGLIALGCGAEAQDVIEQTLERDWPDNWDSALARLYGDCKGESTLTQIERAEKWLRTHARDAALLMALGKLCMRQGLWGKAQSYLEASVALEPSMEAHMTLANLMERLGKPAEAVRHIRRSAELAG
jgi:HemY protein